MGNRFGSEIETMALRIDCDVHPAVGGTRTTLLPYLLELGPGAGVVARVHARLVGRAEGIAAQATVLLAPTGSP